MSTMMDGSNAVCPCVRDAQRTRIIGLFAHILLKGG